MSEVLYDCSMFLCEKVDSFAVMRLKSEIYLIYADMFRRDELLDFMSRLEDDDGIKGLVFLNQEVMLDDGVVLEYVRSMFCEEATSERKSSKISKYFNSLFQLVNRVSRFSKPIVSGMQGEVNYEHLGISLVSDMRFATPETRFLNGALVNGFPHMGAVPYFLRKAVGDFRTKHLLMNQESFTVQEALDMGLVSEIVDTDKLEEACIGQLVAYARRPSELISSIRRLNNPCDEGLETYMKRAQKHLLRFMYVNC